MTERSGNSLSHFSEHGGEKILLLLLSYFYPSKSNLSSRDLWQPVRESPPHFYS